MAAGSRIRFRGFTWSVAILGITFWAFNSFVLS